MQWSACVCMLSVNGMSVPEHCEHQPAVLGEICFGSLALHVGSKCSHGSLCRSLSTMPAKLGINGFGRIGRLVFRAAMANPDVEVRGLLVRECWVLAAVVSCLEGQP